MVPANDLRGFLKILQDRGDLTQVGKEVDPRYELPGIMFKAALAGRPALFFNRVKGKAMPVVGNACASRARLSLALGCSEEETREVFHTRLARPLAPEVIASGPCQEVVETEVDVAGLPIITVHEYDAGPYITCGVLVAKHPKSRVANLSLHRVLPLDKRRAAIFINPGSDLAQYRRAAGDQPLPIALAIGLHPTFLMAGAIKFPMSQDELAVVGGLLGQPVSLVKCRTIDLEAPAQAEIILEGEISAQETAPEGPFGEFPGYYGAGSLQPKEAPVINFFAMYHRAQPIYQALLCGPTLGHESTYLHCLSREGAVYAAVKGVCPQVVDARIDPSRFIGAIQVAKGYRPGDVGLIMAAALADNSNLKYVVVVDQDVDLASPADLFWAMATRVDPRRDFHLFPAQKMNVLDPSTNGICMKVGIDATISLSADRKGFTRTRIPGLETICLEEYLPDFIKDMEIQP